MPLMRPAEQERIWLCGAATKAWDRPPPLHLPLTHLNAHHHYPSTANRNAGIPTCSVSAR